MRQVTVQKMLDLYEAGLLTEVIVVKVGVENRVIGRTTDNRHGLPPEVLYAVLS